MTITGVAHAVLLARSGWMSMTTRQGDFRDGGPIVAASSPHAAESALDLEALLAQG
jgi:hypothetical protein